MIHGPIVVLGKFLDFFSRDGFYMLVKLIRADSLNEIFNCAFNFIVFALQFLRFISDPDFLHLYKVV